MCINAITVGEHNNLWGEKSAWKLIFAGERDELRGECEANKNSSCFDADKSEEKNTQFLKVKPVAINRGEYNFSWGQFYWFVYRDNKD